MSETKFTKGEWVALPIEDDKEYIRIRGAALGGRYKIANVTDLKLHHDGKGWCLRESIESIANAHLIAAAPEMYSELQSILSSPYTEIDEEGLNRIEKLLAKARGEL